MLANAREKRDRRFRAKLLLVLFEVARTSPTRTLLGRVLIDQVNGLMGPGQAIEDDAQALGLVRDLVQAGFALEHEVPGRRRGQAFGLDWVRFEITDRGTLLHKQEITPHPLVDDDRVFEE